MSEAERGRLLRGYPSRQGDPVPSDWKSPYDFEPEELQVLIRRNQSPIWTMNFNVATAQTIQNPVIINQPGRAFRIQGITTATLYDPVANTGIETVASSVFVAVALLNQQGNNQSGISDPSEFMRLKHGGGYRGDFLALALAWPAQSGNTVRITIYRYDGVPWQNGDTGT